MAWKTWPPKATKWEYNKKTKMVYMYHVIHLNGSHFRKGQKLWTQFPKVFHIYIYIYIYIFVTWMHADLWFHEDHKHILPTAKKGYLFIFVSNLQGSESSRCLLSTFVLRLGKSYACKWEERTSVSPCLCIFGHRRPADNGRQWAQQGSKGTSPHVRRAWFQTHTLW